MVYGYGSTGAAIGENMGWLYYGDVDVSGNQSGWITNPSSNPQPMVMIPHAYTPWKSYPNSISYPGGTGNNGRSYATSTPCVSGRSGRFRRSRQPSNYTQKDNYRSPVRPRPDRRSGLVGRVRPESDGLTQRGS
jgi:hypothetical protein